MSGIVLTEVADATIPTPPSGKVTVYFSTEEAGPAWKDDAAAVTPLQGATGATGATGAAGATGATGPAGADGLATSGTPAVVLSTTAAAGVATTALATDAQIIAFDATAPSTQAFGDAAATGSAVVTARRDHKHGMPASPLGLPLGLTGAVAATRYVGGTASGAPASGTFAVGDFVITQDGSVYICTSAGTPGTWSAVSGGGGGGNTSGQLIAGFDAGDFMLIAGKQQDIIAPFTGTITSWTILANGTGSAVVDVWVDTYTNYPPAVGDSITASAKPTLSGSDKATSSTLTGWSTAITAGDILRINLDSVSDLSRILIVLAYSRP